MSPFVQVVWPAGGGGVPGDATARTAAAGDSYFAQTSPGTYGTADKAYQPYSTQATLSFVRFALAVPKDATITSAEFTWWCGRFPSNTLATPADNLTVACEQVDDAAQITARATLLTRYGSAGTTTVTWSSAVTVGENDPHTSSDLAAVVQEIVNRAGWVSGNHIGLFISHAGSGSSDDMAWYLHATGAAGTYHPRLYVEYTS